MSEHQQQIIEPDKNFQLILQKRWDILGWKVDQSTVVVSGPEKRKSFMSFICRLPNNERNTVFKDLYKALDNNHIGISNTFGFVKEKIYKDYMEVYGEISDYLGETYFKNYRVATPKYGAKGHLELPK